MKENARKLFFRVFCRRVAEFETSTTSTSDLVSSTVVVLPLLVVLIFLSVRAVCVLDCAACSPTKAHACTESLRKRSHSDPGLRDRVWRDLTSARCRYRCGVDDRGNRD